MSTLPSSYLRSIWRYIDHNCCVSIHAFSQQELEDAIALLRSALLVKTRVLLAILWCAFVNDILQKLAGYEKSRKHFGPSSTQTLVLHTKLVVV